MNKTTALFGLLLASLAAMLVQWSPDGRLHAAGALPNTSPPAQADSWRGVHMNAPSKSELPRVKQAIAEVLAPAGVNVIILEVNYSYAWKSYPSFAPANALDKEDARDLAALCRKHSIRLIPQFNCLGHQSWARQTFALLKQHPEFDETPRIPMNNPGIYCRSWCPFHPDVNKVVFTLMDELIDAFQADAFHVGMDEVFLIASDQCPRCRGKDPAECFARAVNDYHEHLVKDKGLTMLMWADRLLDDKTMKYGKWESSDNGTYPAIDRIPKDIILCDWHYEPPHPKAREDLPDYPSVPYFQSKGFRVWPAGWRNEKAALAFLKDSRRYSNDKLVGYLCTTWCSSGSLARALLGEKEASPGRRGGAGQIAATLQSCLREMKK
jgi:Glycosyl hydrolase family 20, catalytic domain